MQQASTASANAETQMQNQTQDQKTTDNRGFWGNVLPVGGQILGGIIGGVMDLGEKERSEAYLRTLKLAIDNFDETKKQIDIVEKKETLRLIFKSVAINGGAITTVRLYPPFQQMYEEVLKECNILKNKGITTQTQPDQEACILSPSVAR